MDLEIKTKDGFSVLQCLMQEDRDAVADLLLKAGVNAAEMNVIDKDRTALHYAALWNAHKCAKVIFVFVC